MRIALALAFIGLALAASPLCASPTQSVRDAHADLAQLPADVQRHTRYLALFALAPEDRPGALAALSFWANSLSRNSDLVRPVLVGDALVRVNLVDYGWKAETWDKLAETDPYYHQWVRVSWPGGTYKGSYWKAGVYPQLVAASWLPAREFASLVQSTVSKAPIVRADWWLAVTSRQLSLTNKQVGTGYYDFLGLKNRGDFFKLIRLSEKDSLAIGKEMRAAVLRSGVAQENRQVVRLQALTGGAWATFDTDDSTGKGNALTNLKRGEFKHKAEEHYGVLPNGMFAYLLCDDQGALQPSAPDFIGPDDSPLRQGRDGRIHVGLSCVRCHTEGLRPIDDWVRRVLRQPLGLQSVDYQELAQLRRQYFSDLDRQLRRDRSVFEEALLDANGLSPADNARTFAQQWNRYVEQALGVEQASRELGLTSAQLIAAIKKYAQATGQVPAEVAGLLQDPPVGIRREHWEEVYPKAQEIARFAPCVE